MKAKRKDFRHGRDAAGRTLSGAALRHGGGNQRRAAFLRLRMLASLGIAP